MSRCRNHTGPEADSYDNQIDIILSGLTNYFPDQVIWREEGEKGKEICKKKVVKGIFLFVRRTCLISVE